MNRHLLTFSFCVGVMSATSAVAQTLTNVQLFARCYAQLTQLRAPADHPQLLLVKNSAKDPIAACMAVFDKARLTASNNTRFADANDPEAKAVMRTMHKLHTTWFDVKDTVSSNNGVAAGGTRDMMDMESPALYFTRVLLRPSTPFREVVTFGLGLRSIRTNMNPAKGAFTDRVKTDYIFGASTPFAPIGELLGVRGIGAQEFLRSYSYTPPNQTDKVEGSIDIAAHYGGGILSDQAYLMQNVALQSAYKADGAEKMPRKYGRAIFSDLLCRTLPVIRTEDAVPFVVPNSPVAFRVSSGCVRCHASMDRVAATARNFAYVIRGVAGQPIAGHRGIETLVPRAVTKPEEASWPSMADVNYYLRPSNGVFYFRNLRGELIDTPVTSLTNLGTVIAAQDDFYACAAKRYYNYFTGIDVDIGDVGDPAAGIWLTPRDEYHRAKVLQLGTTLKTSQSARALIEAILRLPAYRRTDFGARLTQ